MSVSGGMSRIRLIRPFLTLIAFVLCLTVSIAVDGLAQSHLKVYFRDGAGLPGDTNVTVDVMLENYSDTVAAVELWFRIDRPMVATFQMEVDTAKTLIAGWDYLDVRAVDSAGYDVKVATICDVIPPFTKRGIPPQSGTTPLFRLKTAIFSQPDPFTEEAVVYCDPELDHFGFATPQGQSIGISFRPALDTTYWNCITMIEDSCIEWEEVPGPPADSVHIEVIQVAYVDSTKVGLETGKVRIAPEVCGDIDGSLDAVVSLADLTRMIDHLFITLSPLQIPALGNTDGSPDGEISLGDLTALIDHLFGSLGPLDCNLPE